mmetsp:Transcript_12373/g.43586  ORF Transcript_12373/g.43586 Transcript_12373/m.43586 type:complete len:200 (+) Transcript_12373:132-731(+)
MCERAGLGDSLKQLRLHVRRGSCRSLHRPSLILQKPLHELGMLGLALLAHQLLEGQVGRSEVRVEVLERHDHVAQSRSHHEHGDTAGSTRGQHAGHQHAIEHEAVEDVSQLGRPEDATQIGLSGLGKRDEVPVHHPADQKVDEGDNEDRWAESAEYEADDQYRRPACAAGADAIVVLVLRLRHRDCLFLLVQGREDLEF